MPIRVRDILRTNLSLSRHILQPLLRPLNINHAVNDRMRDVHAFRRELLRYTSRQGTQGEFGRREAGHERVGFDGGGCAGEDEGWWVLGFLVFGVLEEARESALREEESAFAVGMRAFVS